MRGIAILLASFAFTSLVAGCISYQDESVDQEQIVERLDKITAQLEHLAAQKESEQSPENQSVYLSYSGLRPWAVMEPMTLKSPCDEKGVAFQRLTPEEWTLLKSLLDVEKKKLNSAFTPEGGK